MAWWLRVFQMRKKYFLPTIMQPKLHCKTEMQKEIEIIRPNSYLYSHTIIIISIVWILLFRLCAYLQLVQRMLQKREEMARKVNFKAGFLKQFIYYNKRFDESETNASFSTAFVGCFLCYLLTSADSAFYVHLIIWIGPFYSEAAFFLLPFLYLNRSTYNNFWLFFFCAHSHKQTIFVQIDFNIMICAWMWIKIMKTAHSNSKKKRSTGEW